MNPRIEASNQNTPNGSSQYLLPCSSEIRMNPKMTRRHFLVNQGFSITQQFVRPISTGKRSVVHKLRNQRRTLQQLLCTYLLPSNALRNVPQV
jgi:hypothetical protein